MQNDPRMAQQVRGIYNYQVGQKSPVGWVILIVGIAGGAVYFLASTVTMMHRIFEGLRPH